MTQAGDLRAAHPVRVLSWRETERAVRVRHEAGRGWHVELWVRYPGATRARRVRITWAPGVGRLESRDLAERVASRIRGLAEYRPLHEVVREYAQRDVPENLVAARWESEWLPEVRRRRRQDEVGPERLRSYEAYARRGYLRFWDGASIYNVDSGSLERWVGWMRDNYPAMKPITLRHILADFVTFLRWSERVGTLSRAPTPPTIKVPREKRSVPTREALQRILGAIPEERRGLWLARAQAGLRPAEARRLAVAHYSGGVIYLPASIVKTKEERHLNVAMVAPELDAWIAKYRADANPGEPLFPNPSSRRRDKRWGKCAEQECWRRACIHAGVAYIAPNRGGRHAFATHEAKSGTNLLGLQRWLGHSQFKTTEKYIGEWDSVELARVMRPTPTKDRPANEKRSEKLNGDG